MTRSADFFVDMAKGYEAYDKATDAWKAAQASKAGIQAIKTAKTAIKVGKLGVTAASNVVPIVGPIVTTIILDVALNSIIGAVTDYFTYRNTINIYPLTKNGSPFCVSTKGAKYLIPGSMSTPYQNDDVEFEDETDELEV